MKLTVLGKYGPYPRMGGACSSYLVESGTTRLVLDMGSGSLSNLMRYTDVGGLDAILLTHLHSDHISDLLVFRYALQIKKCKPILLYLPASPENTFLQFSSEPVFLHTAIKDKMIINIKDISIEFCLITHPVESYAIKIMHEGKTLVYSGDTSSGDALASFAHRANLLLCDAAFSDETVPQNAPHLTAKAAAKTAKAAEVQNLLLTHINPDQDENELIVQAKNFFEHSVVAIENQTYIL